MYDIVEGTTHGLSDAAGFIDTLNALAQDQRPEARGLFNEESEIIVARAPGRLDVMGGIADYSGSMVLEMPIREATFVALERDPTRNLKIVSLSEETNRETLFEMSLADFESAGLPVDYETARLRFQSDPARRWAAYAAGVFLVLMRERGIVFQDGARILIDSRVPEGKGVSSSASLEVAVMQAVAAAYHITVTQRDIALLCQTVENRVVGAPCGVMDQMTSALGAEGRLLALLCQPAELFDPVAIADDIAFWGIDSGARHSVEGDAYGSVRVGAFMGYRIISDMAGLEVRHLAQDEPLRIYDPQWRGYLANFAPSEFEQNFASRLPERIGGAEFLSRYQGTTDSVTRISPERIYDVKVSTSHPVYDHHRARLFAELLAATTNERSLQLLGELMYQSHASYSACGLGSEGTDRLVQLARETGPSQGIYGARITGGGSGGTVAVLGKSDAGAAIESIASRYQEETGILPYIFSGSSMGSAAFGHLKLKKS